MLRLLEFKVQSQVEQLEHKRHKRYRQSKSVGQAMQSERQNWIHGFGSFGML